MNILLVNQIWFKDEWQKDGDVVFTVGTTSDFDYKMEFCMNIKDIITKFPNNFIPDVIVVFDNSAPLYIIGLEDMDVPVIFYSVDIHHHYELHSYLYHVFDKMFVAMRDYIPYLNCFCGSDVEWLPLWASKIVDVSNEKKYGAVFVGTLNEKLNPDRVHFFNKLREKTDVLCMQGKWWEIFPYSEIVINQTVKGDLNFRVFEAMGTGSLLLTENSSNGLLDIFEDKKHLVTYKKNDVEDARSLIDYFLNHKKEAQDIAMTGREEILKKHLPRHRADLIKESFKNIKKKNSNSKYLAMAFNFICIFTKAKHLVDFSNSAITLAMEYLEKVSWQEIKLIDRDFFIILKICINYDIRFFSKRGMNLLEKIENISNYEGIPAYKAWCAINSGNKKEALTILFNGGLNPNTDNVFNSLNKFICQFIEDVNL